MSISKIMDDDAIIANYLDVIRYGEENSGCNKGHLGAGLFFKNGDVLYGANGVIEGSCREKGQDYCIREKSDIDPYVQYTSCPSLCAEGTVLWKSRFFNPQDIEDSILISTNFPCGRCTALMHLFALMDVGIKELYFGVYKEDEPREKDIFYADMLIDAGIRVNQIKDIGGGVYEIVPICRSANSLKYYGRHGFKLLNPVPYETICLTNAPADIKSVVRA